MTEDPEDRLAGIRAALDACRDDALGPECPVRPLGYLGDRFVFSDAEGQLQVLSRSAMGQPYAVLGLFFGDTQWLNEVAPLVGGRRAGSVTWDHGILAPLLMQACRSRGAFDAERSWRGVGIWRGEDGALVIHCGDQVWLGSPSGEDDGFFWDKRPAGERYGPHFYPRLPEVWTPPDDETTLTPEGDRRMAGFCAWLERAWTWEDGRVMPSLALGAAAVLAAPEIQPVRPVLEVCGPSGSGKSTLARTLAGLTGWPILLKNITAPGVMKRWADAQTAMGVLVDEYERGDGDEGVQAALRRKAREAYDVGGARELRGGRDGTDRTLNAAFGFISITPPAVGTADANRMIFLRLKPLKVTPDDVERFDRIMAGIEAFGCFFRRRILDVAPLFPDAFTIMRRALAKADFSVRWQNTLGVVMAWEYLLRYAELPKPEGQRGFISALGDHVMAAANEAEPPEWACLTHLLTTTVEIWQGGGKRLLGEMIEQALGPDPDRHVLDTCKRWGVAVTPEKADRGSRWLRVAYTHGGLEQIFRGTRWAGGGWSVLLQIPGAERRKDPVRFGEKTRLMAYHLPGTAVQGRRRHLAIQEGEPPGHDEG